jgi:hypothetical protein
MLLGLIMVTGLIKQGCCVAVPLGGCHICRSRSLSCALVSLLFFLGCRLCPGSLLCSRNPASLQPLVTLFQFLNSTSCRPGALCRFFSSVGVHEHHVPQKVEIDLLLEARNALSDHRNANHEKQDSHDRGVVVDQPFPQSVQGSSHSR